MNIRPGRRSRPVHPRSHASSARPPKVVAVVLPDHRPLGRARRPNAGTAPNSTRITMRRLSTAHPFTCVTCEVEIAGPPTFHVGLPFCARLRGRRPVHLHLRRRRERAGGPERPALPRSRRVPPGRVGSAEPQTVTGARTAAASGSRSMAPARTDALRSPGERGGARILIAGCRRQWNPRRSRSPRLPSSTIARRRPISWLASVRSTRRSTRARPARSSKSSAIWAWPAPCA